MTKTPWHSGTDPSGRLVFGLMGWPALFAGLVMSCNAEPTTEAGKAPRTFPGTKVLYIDSYDSSYAPNIEARQAFERGIAKRGLSTTWAFLDEKNLVDSSRLARRAAEIADLVQQLKPDIVVSADDPAMTYVVEPYLSGGTVPVVFIGVNWEAPNRAPRMTGQIEVELIERLASDLTSHARGRRVGVLTAATATDRKSLAVYREILGKDLVQERLVETFAAWKSAFRTMQDSVDVLIVRQNAGILGWDSAEAVRWASEWTRIPTGSPNRHMGTYVLLTYPKRNDEFGHYAAGTVLDILGGTAPSDIPIARNRRMGVIVNTILMRKLKVELPAEMMEGAQFVPVPRGRVAFVNSYHRGYEWSDGIERGFLKALGILDSAGGDSYEQGPLQVRLFRMDAKAHPDEPFQTTRAEAIHQQLQKWRPDVIVAADDDASKWLVVPYYKGGTVPVLFCGLNWDASVYGFPTTNVTGMVEVASVRPLIEQLSQHTKGRRMGFLGADVRSEIKELGFYRRSLGIPFADGAMVTSANGRTPTVGSRVPPTC